MEANTFVRSVETKGSAWTRFAGSTQARDHAVLICFGVIMVTPLAMVIWGAGRLRGLSGKGDAWSFDGWIANYFQLNELLRSTGAPELSGLIGSSLVLALAIAFVTTIAGFLAAFAMMILDNRVASACFWITLTTLLFPIEARMLSTFDVTANLGLIGSWTGMVLPVLPLALATLVFRQHFKTFPGELREAARVDGAGPMLYLKDFAVPLSFAPLGAVFLISFVYGWNQYLWPLLVSIDNVVYPLMRGLSLAGTGSGEGLVIATASMLPPLVLVLAFLRLLTRLTAIRG
jgi:sn-glycerol 3-phosphate transport system permease protein